MLAGRSFGGVLRPFDGAYAHLAVHMEAAKCKISHCLNPLALEKLKPMRKQLSSIGVRPFVGVLRSFVG